MKDNKPSCSKKFILSYLREAGNRYLVPMVINNVKVFYCQLSIFISNVRLLLMHVPNVRKRGAQAYDIYLSSLLPSNVLFMSEISE
jgi:hypothetical protein